MPLLHPLEKTTLRNTHPFKSLDNMQPLVGPPPIQCTNPMPSYSFPCQSSPAYIELRQCDSVGCSCAPWAAPSLWSLQAGFELRAPEVQDLFAAHGAVDAALSEQIPTGHVTQAGESMSLRRTVSGSLSLIKV